jgi:hypothetical protein
MTMSTVIGDKRHHRGPATYPSPRPAMAVAMTVVRFMDAAHH